MDDFRVPLVQETSIYLLWNIVLIISWDIPTMGIFSTELFDGFATRWQTIHKDIRRWV